VRQADILSVSACMEAECNSAGRTDLEVYVPYLLRSGRRGDRSPREEEEEDHCVAGLYWKTDLRIAIARSGSGG
jgi:hypothetical protein